MKHLIVLFLSLFSMQLNSQIQAVCDEAAELPNGFTLDFFVIFDAIDVTTFNPSENYRYTVEISADSLDGEQIFSSTHYLPPALETSGFISVDLGRPYNLDYSYLLDYINENPDKQYFAELFVRVGFQNIKLGFRQLSAVPYAQVANVLGGKGKTGAQGAEGAQGLPGPAGRQNSPGAQGAQGPPGPDGDPGTFDFENNLLIMTNIVPTSGVLYVDDGTNTDDGLPHLRYNLNGTWIDL